MERGRSDAPNLRAAGYGYYMASEANNYIIQFIENYVPRKHRKPALVKAPPPRPATALVTAPPPRPAAVQNVHAVAPGGDE